MSTRFILVQLGLLVGMAVSGPLADRFGAPLVYITAGLLLMCAALAGLLFRDLREATFQPEAAADTLRASAVV